MLCLRAHRIRAGLTWDVVASPSTPREQVALTLRIRPEQVKRPQGYYVNVHNPGFPAGALRGQLRSDD